MAPPSGANPMPPWSIDEVLDGLGDEIKRLIITKKVLEAKLNGALAQIARLEARLPHQEGAE